MSANLLAIVDAIRASDRSVALAPDDPSEPERTAETAARDAEALYAIWPPMAANGAGPAIGSQPGQQPAAADSSQRQAAGGQAGEQHTGLHQLLMVLQQQMQQQSAPPPQPLPPQQQQQAVPPPPQQQQQQPQPTWMANVNMSVAGLMQAVGLSEYLALFEEQSIDMAALELLSRDDLKELGLPLGAIVKITAAVREQQQRRQQPGAGSG